MSNDILREAAAKMRERAEATTPGPWITHEMGHIFVGNQADGRTSGLWEIVHMSGGDLSDLMPEAAERDRSDAQHIASWHPAVALAVADWLDAMADHIDVWTKDYEPGEIRHCDVGTPADSNCVDAALAVARTFLGGDA